MIELLLKAVASGVSESVKLTTEAAMIKVEATMEKVRTETREMVSDGLQEAQLMLLQTIIIGFCFLLGLYYLGDGLTDLLDLYTNVPGTGATFLGILFLLFGFFVLMRSKKRIEKLKQE